MTSKELRDVLSVYPDAPILAGMRPVTRSTTVAGAVDDHGVFWSLDSIDRALAAKGASREERDYVLALRAKVRDFVSLA